MSYTSVDASWAILRTCREFAIIGRDVIATASGVYVRFYDTRNGETRVERFDGGERGDGACCLAGLSLASIFSVVEKKPNPKISIFAYPSIRRIGVCTEGEEAIGYLCCTFAATEYLIAQTTYPSFRLIVWRWSTGERLATVDARNATNCNVDLTTIVCSTDVSRLVAQLTPSTGTLSVYRIFACSKLVRLYRVELRCERSPVSCCWLSDGTLLCGDEFGNVWSVDCDDVKTETRGDGIVARNSPDQESRPLRTYPVLVAHGGGVLIAIDRSSTERHRDVRATFYRKRSKDRNEEWSSIWSISLATYPKQAKSIPRRDSILILGDNGDLYEIVAPSRHGPPRLESLLRNGKGYKTIVPLSGRYFGALDRTDRFAVRHVTTGSPVSSKHLAHHGRVAQLTSHPFLPILASCSDQGSCLLLLDATVPSSPKINGCAHLQNETLDRVKFSEGGRLLAVAASSNARLFLLTSRMAVAVRLQVGRKMIDFLVYETTNDDHSAAKVLVLVGESNHSTAGHEIHLYRCKFSGDVYENVDHRTILASSFDSLHGSGGHGIEASREIIGVPCLSKQLHRMELKNNFRDAVNLEVLPSLHQIGGTSVGVYLRSGDLLTFGFDGLIVSRDSSEPRKVLALFVAHHRTEGGVACAIFADTTVVSLGRNGDLVGNKLPHRLVPVTGRRGDSRSTSFTDSCCRWIRGRIEASESEETCSNRHRSTYRQNPTLARRLSVLNDWNELKRRVKELLDENEAAPASARLPISAFDLDREARERKLAEARTKEELLTKDAEERIARYDRASRYFRETFLNSLAVKPRTVFSFSGRSKITNYPLAKFRPGDTELLSWCRFSMKIRETVSRLEEEEEGKNRRGCRTKDRPGFVELREACVVAEHEERELKARFNERFEKTRSTKKKEMSAANERIEKTRRFVDELALTFRVDVRSNLLGADVPRWHPTELFEEEFHPDNRPSIAEETTTTTTTTTTTDLDLDDFHREAVDRMMDGVLERRLEDNAKRIIPVPDCLLRTEYPFDNANEENVRAIESYEKKLRIREDDRRKYKSVLETEIEEIEEEFWKNIQAFDDQLCELTTEKIEGVERPLLTERLQRVQAMLQHRTLVEAKREIQRKVELELVPMTKKARDLAEDCELFEAEVIELRNRYEGARRRENQLELNFRTELADLTLSPPLSSSSSSSSTTSSMEEHLFRHYRRRPRTLERNCGASVVFLTELASCLVEERYSDSLPREYDDCLRRMEELDRMPDGLSSRVKPEHWRAVCRLRRSKLEAETKVRSYAIQVAEAEQSLAFMRNATSVCRATANRCKEEIEREEKSLTDRSANDRETTFFLKTGQLGMQAKGCPHTDWEDAVLVPREQLIRANQAIVEAERQLSVARQKLENVEELVGLEERRHARVRATMQGLQEEAKDLESFKVSRLALECCELSKLEEAAKGRKGESVEKARRKELVEAIEKEKRKAVRIEREVGIWRGRNAKLTEEMEEMERSTANKYRPDSCSRDCLRSKGTVFVRRRRLEGIRRKARLARLIKENTEELSKLKTRLEISKLRTYPTLSAKDQRYG